MANGNTEVIREMREIIKAGKAIDIDTRDRLLFSAVIDIYEHLARLDPALTFYKVGLWFATALGVSVLGLIFSILTGKIELVFR